MHYPENIVPMLKIRNWQVLLTMKTFNRMESIIEDYGPAGCMEEAEDGETLTAHEAKKHYRSSKKDCQSGRHLKRSTSRYSRD